MKYQIKISGKETIKVIIESNLSPDCALFSFLKNHYPTELWYEYTGNDEETSPVLKDKLNGDAVIWRDGDEKADTYLGLISITPVAEYHLDTEAISPEEFQLWCANIWHEKMQEAHDMRMHHFIRESPNLGNIRLMAVGQDIILRQSINWNKKF